MRKVLIVEDDAAFRSRFADIIQSDPEFTVSAAVGSAGEGIAAIDRAAPDVLLVDLGLPDKSGIDVIRHAAKVAPHCESMVVTVFGDEAHVLASIEAGATGYLLKDASADQFLASIRELVAGGSPISPVIARGLLRRFVPNPVVANNESNLSDREREILKLVAKGFNFGEIGGILGISPHTVTSHIKKIYRKMAVHSRGEAVYEAQRMGLLDSWPAVHVSQLGNVGPKPANGKKT
ncbi:MAG: response regulator transcription factor [Betaproteobacteria bacterium]|nr:response regulator transcription factor [Betaproteobacteria bacterium]